MTSQAIKFELVTAIGTFEFKKHFNSDADPYEAMKNFESNNWKMLVDNENGIEYRVTFKYEDGDIQTTEFTGMNAGANLQASLDESDMVELQATINAYTR